MCAREDATAEITGRERASPPEIPPRHGSSAGIDRGRRNGLKRLRTERGAARPSARQKAVGRGARSFLNRLRAACERGHDYYEQRRGETDASPTRRPRTAPGPRDRREGLAGSLAACPAAWWVGCLLHVVGWGCHTPLELSAAPNATLATPGNLALAIWSLGAGPTVVFIPEWCPLPKRRLSTLVPMQSCNRFGHGRCWVHGPQFRRPPLP